MKKSLMKKISQFIGGGVLALSLLSLASCGEDSGLGGAIDTKAPSLSIDYPPSSAAVRDKFVLSGTCSDDKSIGRVIVTVKNVDTKEDYGSYVATLNSAQTEWQVTLNDYDASNSSYYNGWQYPDGTYEVSVTAYDNAGNNSGTNSKTLEIDNTPPVFVITKPGVAREKNLLKGTISKYGSLFTIEGTIAEVHNVETMDVTVYDENNEQINVEPYQEEEIATVGGSNVTIARYVEDGVKDINKRYAAVYAIGTADENGTKKYFCTVTLADSARIYQNPSDGTGVVGGNSTSVVYLYDDIYTKYMSAKNGAGLSANNFRAVLNRTAKDSDFEGLGKDTYTVEQVRAALEENAKDTSSKEANALAFSLNPNADPTYSVAGFAVNYSSDGSTFSGDTKSATNGATITVSVSQGLDQVKIDPPTIKVWVKAVGTKDNGVSKKDILREDIDELVAEVKRLEENETEITEYSTEIATSKITDSKWLNIKNNSDDNSASDSIVTLSTSLPTGIQLNEYYVIVVTGQDVEECPVSQNSLYGFIGNVSGTPPAISFETPASLDYFPSSAKYTDSTETVDEVQKTYHVIGDSEIFKFTGYAKETSENATLKSLKATLTVTDEDTGDVKATKEFTITGSSDHTWTSVPGFSCAYDSDSGKDNWTFTPSALSDYGSIKAEDTGLSYMYTLQVIATGSTGHTSSADRSIHIDTKNPVPTVSSITPTVEDYEDFESTLASKYSYLNGTITVKGSVEEQNLKNVTYDIWASDKKLDETLNAADSILTRLTAKDSSIDGKIGKAFSFAKSISTTAISEIFKTDLDPDPMIQVVFVVKAEDIVGNTATSYLSQSKKFVVCQRTDQPIITLSNADSSVTTANGITTTTNLFGTTSNNTLQVSFSDDDTVAEYEIYIYDSEGTTQKATSGKQNPQKTTASIKYQLPSEEGEYQVKVIARDFLSSDTATDTNKPYNVRTVGNFFVAVDSGAPKVTVSTVGGYKTNGFKLEGTISPSSKAFGKGTTIEAYFVNSDGEKISAYPSYNDSAFTKDNDALSWSIPAVTFTEPQSGDYTLRVTAKDKYTQTGNAEFTFMMDGTAPQIKDIEADKLVKLDESDFTTINAVAGDDFSGVYSFGYCLSESENAPDSYDSVTWTPMNQGQTVTWDSLKAYKWNATVDVKSSKPTDGTIYVYYGAKDNAGNITIYSEKTTLTTDATAPSITMKSFDGETAISDKGTATTNDSSKTFTVTVLDSNVESLTVPTNSGVTVGTGTEVTGGKSYPITVSWAASSDTNNIEDTKTVTFTATDSKNRSAKATATLKCDNYAPRITIDTYSKSVRATSLTINGTIRDANFSDGLEVWLVPVGTTETPLSSSAVTTANVSTTGGTWKAIFSGASDIEYNIAIRATDSFTNAALYSTTPSDTTSLSGFETEANVAQVGYGSLMVDSVAPSLTNGSVKIGTSSSDAAVAEQYFANGGSDLYIEGKATDKGTGVKTVKIGLNGQVSEPNSISADFDSETGTFSATIQKEKITAENAGTVYAQIVDNAGNSTDANLLSLVFDNTAPVIQNYTFVDNDANYTAYKKSTDEYYIHAGNGHTFTLSGIATDNLGLAKVSLTIGSGTPSEITDSDKLSEWKFENLSFTADTTAKIVVTDKAGNKSLEKTITVKVDNTAPVGRHEFDSKGKDLYFRVGTSDNTLEEVKEADSSDSALADKDKNVGGKYSLSTFGNSLSMTLRGYFTEEGSGVNTIYYKLLTIVPTEEDISTFVSNYTSNTGTIAPLSANETKRVVYTSADGPTRKAKDIESSFKANISGFSENANYLILVAVDNVGNAAHDTYSVKVDSSAASDTAFGYYTLNVDTVAPEITTDQNEVLLTNGEGAETFTITGTATDAFAGVSSISLTFGTSSKTITISQTADATTGDIVSLTDAGDSSDSNKKKWEATIHKKTFATLDSGNYSISAIVTDNAGNQQKDVVANATVDTKAPAVVLIQPTDADTATTDKIDINGTISLSGTITDANILPDLAITGIQYVKSDSEPSSSTEWTAATAEAMANLAFTGNYSFTISGFDTTKLEDQKNYYLRAVATDKAGNVGYSSGVKVYVNQDSDRPIVNFTNLELFDGKYVLKYGTDAQISATISDDDGIESASDVVISGSPFTGSETTSGSSTYNTNSKTVTYTPENTGDGSKTIYIYVKDTEGGEFYTSYNYSSDATKKYLYSPKLRIKGEAVTDTDSLASLVTYVSDSTAPAFGTLSALAYQSDGTTENGGVDSAGAYTEYEEFSSSYKLGGTKRQQAKFKITANDANGIKGMSFVISYPTKTGTTKTVTQKTADSIEGTGYTVAGSFSATTDSSNAEWTSDLISFEEAADGDVTFVAYAYDTNGLYSNSTVKFSIDMNGPTVTLTAPTSVSKTSEFASQSNGDVTIVGNAVDSNTITETYWLIPTTEQRSKTDSELAALDGWIQIGNNSIINYTFAREEDRLLDKYIDRYTSTDTDTEAPKTAWYVIPIYFKAVDELGNVGITKEWSIKFNPDADKPIASISYPGENNVLGGTVRMNGTTILGGSAQSGIVTTQTYFQIDEKSDFSTGKYLSSIAKTNDGFGYADNLVDGYALINSGEKPMNAYSSNNQPSLAIAQKYGFATVDAVGEWWGLKATQTSTAAWSYNVNENGELDPIVSENGTSENRSIYIRVCAVNSVGKVGAWSTTLPIKIDNDSPEVNANLHQYSADITTENLSTIDGISVAEKDYNAEMYVRGQWYIVSTVTDDGGLSSISVTKNGTTTTENTDWFKRSIKNNDGKVTEYKVYTKIDKNAGTTYTYKLTAVDDSQLHSTTVTYSINVDNVAPTLSPLYSDSDRKNKISMTKIENSNYVYDLYSSVEEAGSGLDFIAVYFTRGSDTSQKIELPLPTQPTTEGSSSRISTSASTAVSTLASDLTTEDGLYGVKVESSIASSGGSTTITSASISSNDFIRKGMLVKLSGSYYEISSVSENVATVAASFDTTPSYAFFPIAIPVNNTTAEGGQSNGTVITNDDGDGFVDYVKKSGSTYAWETEFFSDELNDGVVSIVVVAGDKAGNYSTTSSDNATTTVQLTNHKPRVAKVYLSTDLNGDGKYVDSELGGQRLKTNSGTITKSFYSALSDTVWNLKADEGKELEGNAQEIVTLTSDLTDSSKANDGVGFTMRNKLGVAFEFVSGNGGQGDVYYQLAYAKSVESKLTAPTAETKAKLSDATGSTYDATDDTVTKGIIGLKGFEINPSDVTTSDVTEWVESDEATHKLSNIGITLWDSTDSKAGTVDTLENGEYTAFGAQWTVINVPIYMDLVDDRFPKPSISDPTAVENAGHVDLKADLPSANFTASSGYLDTDTKISGKVVFTGTITDEKLVKSIIVSTNKQFNSTNMPDTVATYNASATNDFDYTSGLPTGIEFEVTSSVFKNSVTSEEEAEGLVEGHNVTWKLTVDSRYVAEVAASDVLFTVAASDGTNTNGADTTEKYAPYQVDIVPYITGITRSGTTISGGTMNRSYLGKYPVAEGESITVTGYNLGSGFWSVGNNNSTFSYTATSDDTTGLYSFTMKVPALSGKMKVSVNSVESLNNLNDNTKSNNKETFKMSGTSTGYTASDDSYLSVWNLGNYFKNTLKSSGNEFEYPVMTSKPNGELLASWGTPSNGSVTFSYGLAENSTAIYNAYDQPGSYTGIAYDQKGDSEAASVMYMAELQGNGGTYSVTASASDAVVGGAVVTQIGKNDISNKNTYTGKTAVVAGNPSVYLDGDNTTGFYTLQNYDMQRRLGIYEHPQAARYKNYLHNIWYDSLNESLKYSVVNLDEKIDSNELTEAYKDRTAGFAGWVVIDGNYTQQDRVFEWSTNTTNAKTNNKVGGADDKKGTQTGVGSTYYPAVFSKVIFLGSNSNKDHNTTNYIGTTTTTTLVMQNAEFATDPAIGDSIALLDNTNGGYKIVVSEITNYDSNTKTITWADALPSGFTLHSATIYQGDMNVVGGTTVRSYGSFYRTPLNGLNNSESAGSSAAIDVTAAGYPVIAYYDATNSRLLVAIASSENPKLASAWTRYDTGKTCSGEVSVKVDGDSNIHIMYNNNEGVMCYVYGKNNNGSYTWSAEEQIDDTGSLSYGSISVIKKEVTEAGSAKYIPTMTWLNKANTANSVKYAQRSKAMSDETDINNPTGEWDFMIVPSLGNGHYALKENPISIESSNAWNGTGDVLKNQLDTAQPSTATPATVDSVLAYKTSKAYETAYLKKE